MTSNNNMEQIPQEEEEMVHIKLLESYQRLFVNDELPQQMVDEFRRTMPDVVDIWDEAKKGEGPHYDEMKELFMKGITDGSSFEACGFVSRRILAEWRKEKSTEQKNDHTE